MDSNDDSARALGILVRLAALNATQHLGTGPDAARRLAKAGLSTSEIADAQGVTMRAVQLAIKGRGSSRNSKHTRKGR